jgi:hypothetical protein
VKIWDARADAFPAESVPTWARGLLVGPALAGKRLRAPPPAHAVSTPTPFLVKAGLQRYALLPTAGLAHHGAQP